MPLPRWSCYVIVVLPLPNSTGKAIADKGLPGDHPGGRITHTMRLSRGLPSTRLAVLVVVQDRVLTAHAAAYRAQGPREFTLRRHYRALQGGHVLGLPGSPALAIALRLSALGLQCPRLRRCVPYGAIVALRGGFWVS